MKITKLQKHLNYLTPHYKTQLGRAHYVSYVAKFGSPQKCETMHRTLQLKQQGGVRTEHKYEPRREGERETKERGRERRGGEVGVR